MGPHLQLVPKKKRTRAGCEQCDNLPSPLLLFPSSLGFRGATFHKPGHFGTKTAATKSSDAADPEPGTLFSFWKWECCRKHSGEKPQDFEEYKDKGERELEEE